MCYLEKIFQRQIAKWQTGIGEVLDIKDISICFFPTVKAKKELGHESVL
jgi:hypothetical protein